MSKASMRHKSGYHTKLLRDTSVKGDALIKGEPKWAL